MMRTFWAVLRSCAGVLAVLGLALFSRSAHAASQPQLQLVDDRGQPITEALQVCFELDLKQDCKHVEPGQAILLPADFHRVLVEGSDHALVAAASQALKPGTTGSLRLEVPRKAVLRVTGVLPGELTLSLYDPLDTAFRTPAIRVPVRAGEVKIRAGSFIASFSAKGYAPDLQRISAQAGAQIRASYHARGGWSLLVRCRRAVDGKIAARTHVKVAETPGYGRPSRAQGEASTGSDGLAFFSGLDSGLAGFTAERADFVPTEVGGLTASSGTFAFREVTLRAGGHLRATVTVKGHGLAGATCQVVAYDSIGWGQRATPRTLWEGKADKQGVCRSERLAPGTYKLRIVPLPGRSQVSRWVTVSEGKETPEDIALAPARVKGEVRREGKPVAGYTVSALRLDADVPPGIVDDPVAEETDDAGRYEVTLWEPGRYGFFLRAPSRTSAPSHKELTLSEDDDQQLDFELKNSFYRGVVVDEAARPVEGAHVGLRLAGLYMTATDSAGRFEYPAAEEGTATLTARKAGYRESDPMEVTVESGIETPEVTLVLKKKESRTGTILSASGAPAAGAWVGSIADEPGSGPRVYRQTQADAGGGFDIEIPQGPIRLFVSGPGCPLSRFDLLASESQDADRGVLRCVDQAAALELTIIDANRIPIPHASLILRSGGAVLPNSVLTTHLGLLGLPAETDGSGHLVVAGISPGHYDLFLSTMSSELTVAAGLRQGFLTSVDLAPLSTIELQATAAPDLPAVPALPAKGPSGSVP